MKIAQIGLSTVGLGEVLAGCWVSVQAEDNEPPRGDLCGVTGPAGVVKLPNPLLSELRLLVVLAPLACANLRASTQKNST